MAENKMNNKSQKSATTSSSDNDHIVNRFSPGQVKQFSVEVRNEFGKIVWPDKKHTIASTGVVIVIVTIISFYLGAVDFFLGKLISFILN